MVLKKIIHWSWMTFKLASMSLLLMLAIGQVQLYLSTSTDHYEDIKVGYPYHYYSFSRDGNNFHGSNIPNLISDYLITFGIVSLIYILGRLLKNLLSKN